MWSICRIQGSKLYRRENGGNGKIIHHNSIWVIDRRRLRSRQFAFRLCRTGSVRDSFACTVAFKGCVELDTPGHHIRTATRNCSEVFDRRGTVAKNGPVDDRFAWNLVENATLERVFRFDVV
jgi:hypothetical protein